MVELPNKEFRKLVKDIRNPKKKKEIYQAQEQRKTFWPEYNLSKINEIKSILDFIRNSVNEVKIKKSRRCVGRPPINAHMLAKAILFCESNLTPERQGEGWLELFGPYLGIFDKLDDRVIGEAYCRPDVIYILNEVFENKKTSDGKLGGDGTGLERSRKDNYESDKDRKAGQYMTSIVDSREIVQAFDISGKQECRVMHELIEKVKGESIRLDAGFNDRKLIKKITNLGMTPYVFPKCNNNLNGDPYWQGMYLKFYYNTLEWLKEYHQRSHTESFHSSFKRTFGIITKLRFTCKFTQVLARIIIHNFKRQSYFDKLG